jgi:hypothetical protein
MSVLDKNRLTEMLKKKSIVTPNDGVRILLVAKQDTGKPSENISIVMENDDGAMAEKISNELRQRNIMKVSDKFAKPIVSVMASKAPVIQSKKPSIEKLKGKVLVEEGAEEKGELLPEGGPRLEEEERGTKASDGGPLPRAYAEAEALEVAPRKRIATKRIPTNVIPLGPEANIVFGDTTLKQRLPPPPEFNVAASSYYMNNREVFINFINDLFHEYKLDLQDESKNISCEDIGKDTGEIGLLTHQKIVRDYINLYTPYRGLLLFHGLGSGKTCSSIAIAEGIKSGGKQVIIMTPASLQRNYLEEIKKCGDLIYRKNQYWEWIGIEDNPGSENALSVVLGFQTTEYIKRKRGAWLTNVKKPSNYAQLSTSDKKSLNDQIDEMIRQKYRFINYNGLRRDSFKMMTDDFKNNIFDNSVVVIDEAHNLISRIVNKINKSSKFAQRKKNDTNTLAAEPLAIQIYDYLMRADNCRVVLLTGTPIINYPNEIAVLFNILRGYIKTWNLPLKIETTEKVTKDTFLRMFNNNKNMDYIDYIPTSKTLTITRNPFGFESIITEKHGYQGVSNEKKERRDPVSGKMVVSERGTMSDGEFLRSVDSKLNKSDISINKSGIQYEVYTALPDTYDEFANMFIDSKTGNIINIEKFKKRILGLTSYFRSAQEELLPRYDKNFDKHAIFIPMSDYQFNKYEEYRQEERKSEKIKKGPKKDVIDKNGTFKEPTSTYRIFSRLVCNFAMPTPPGRPIPKQFRRKMMSKFEYDTDGNVTNVTNVIFRGMNVVGVEKGDVNTYVERMADTRKKMDAQEKRDAEEKDLIPPPINKKETLAEKGKKALDNSKIALERVQKALAKADADAKRELEREQKVLQKAEEKAAKEREKEEAKALKEREKALKEQAKAEEKERKALEKALQKAEAKKSKKGGAGSDDEGEKVIWSGDEDSDNEELAGEEEEEEEEADEIDEGGPKGDDDFVEIEGVKDIDAKDRDVDELEGDEMLDAIFGDVEYKTAIAQAYAVIKKYKSQFLTPEKLEIYSPKFLRMLENIQDPEHRGLNLVYSQFRSMEGIGLFALVLEANGFAHFKIKKTGLDSWEINMSEEDMGKPTYALYTGTEDAEEREIIRNIYNGMWDNIPNNIAQQLRSKSANNNMGEIIKVLMITSAGSEGINLRNTRYVHIMEPYWHPVRSEQVIGRARRICSHKDLPIELQTVEVFIYIMVFTQKQLDSDNAIELRISSMDRGKIAPYPIQTTDEKLYEISNIKERLASQLLTGIKEASIDCATYTKSNTKEGLVCLSFGQPSATDFSYNPDLFKDENDSVSAANRITIDWQARPFTDKYGKQYMLRVDTNQVYDHDSVIQALKIPGVRPLLLGKLVKNREGNFEIIRDKV